jgi:hypothetical protein
MTATLAAICQELEKPKQDRKWHGKVAGIIPYDFRLPTIERLRESYWNPYERRVFTPEVFGVGWAVNLYRLLEDLGVIRAGASEEDFLMPTKSMKEVLAHAREQTEG